MFFEVDAIDANAPIVPQLEKFAEANQITLEPGWKVELSKKVKQKFKSNVADDLENKWKDLFGKLQQEVASIQQSSNDRFFCSKRPPDHISDLRNMVLKPRCGE